MSDRPRSGPGRGRLEPAAGRPPGRETLPPDRRQSLGAAGEQLAGEHLVRRGYQILERNYRTRWGELDLVAYDGQALVFCEVKTRRSGGQKGSPFEALSSAKQAQVRKMASRWLHERRERPHVAVIRFDAIGVVFDGAGCLLALEHLEGAF
jgi:putative endonuclease